MAHEIGHWVIPEGEAPHCKFCKWETQWISKDKAYWVYSYCPMCGEWMRVFDPFPVEESDLKDE